MNKIFPILIIALFLGASLMSFLAKDIKMGLFYFLSAAINLVIIL